MKNPLPRSIIGTTLTPNRLFSRSSSILSLSALSLVLSACGGGGGSSSGTPSTDKTPPTDADKTPPTDADKTPPTLTSGGDVLQIDEVEKTFTVWFSEEIRIKKGVTEQDLKNGLVQVFKGDTALVAADIKSIVASASWKLAITVASDDAVPLGDYKVTIRDGAITDLAGNDFAEATTEVDSFAAPELASDGALRINEIDKTFTVYFNEYVQLKESVTEQHLKDGLVQIFKDGTALAGADIESIALHKNLRLVIKLASDDAIPLGAYKVTIKDGAITDLAGYAFAEDTTETDSLDDPTLASDGDALWVDEAEKTFTVWFNEEIQIKEDVTEQDLKDGLVQIFKDDKALAADDIESIVADANKPHANKLVITLATGYTLTNGDYKVTIKDDAITDLVGNAFVGDSTEVDEFVMDIIAPKLYSSADNLFIDEVKKNFFVTFSEKIRIKENVTEQALKDGLVQIFKGDTPLAADDIESIAVDSVFWQKLLITLANKLTNGDYKVTIKDDAITDLAGNAFVGDSTEEDKFVKDITAPELRSGGDALFIDEAEKTFTVFFNEEIQLKKGVTEQDWKDDLVQILKDDTPLAADDIESIAVNSRPFRQFQLVIKLATDYTLTNGNYKITIKDDAITDLLGNPFVGDSTETDEFVKDITAPTLASDGDALWIKEGGNIFTVLFNEEIQIKEDVTEQQLKDGLVQVFKDDTPLAADDIEIIEVDSTNGWLLVIKLADSYDLTNGDYKVTIKDGAITDLLDNDFVEATTEVDSLAAPAFADDALIGLTNLEYSDF